MKLRINIYLCISVVFSIITVISFWIFSMLFDDTVIFYLGLPFALSAFVFSYVLLCPCDKELSFKIGMSQVPNIFLGALTIMSVLAVLLIPAYNGSLFEWVNIPLANWLRYVSSVLLTTFLPGYFLLKTFDSKHSVGWAATIVLSYVMSMFITFITGFVTLLTYNSIFSLANILVVINLASMVGYYLRFYLRRPAEVPLKLSLIGISALVATLTVVIVGNILVMISTLPLSSGDMWNHYGIAFQFLKGFPIHGGMLIPSYPYLFHIYLATFFELTGLPSPASYQALFTLSFISILSFYSFIKEWASKKNMYSVALLLVPLLGFGSLYVMSLKFQNPASTLFYVISNAVPKTYDISDIMVIGPALSNVVPILFIALPTLFMFLYLLKKNLNNVLKSFLCAILVVVSFLGHVDATFFIGLALLLYAIIIKGKDVKTCALGGICGLFIVFILDFSTPARFYIFGIGSTSSSNTLVFFVTLLIFILSYITVNISSRIQINYAFFLSSFVKRLFPLISWSILLSYIFSIITWFYVLPNYSAFIFGHYNFTPFFIWAIRFGPIGLLTIFCLSLFLTNVVRDKNLIFFGAIGVAGFVLEQLANYYPIYPAYRFATLTLIGVIPLAAYFVVKSTSLFARKKRILLTVFLIFLMIPGMLSSSFYYYSTAQLKPAISNCELDALNFVEKNLPSNASVLTFSSDSERKLETFAGVNQLQILYTWNYLLNNLDLSTLLFLLGTSNVKYAYLSNYDFEGLTGSGRLLNDIIDYFPVALQNDNVTIYVMPQMAQPSPQSNFVILNALEQDASAFEQDISKGELALQIMPSLLQLNYSISSLPIDKNTTSIAIDGLQNSSQWITTEGIGEVSLDQKDFVNESPAIVVDNLTTDRYGYFGINGFSPVDIFTQFDSLQLSIKVSEDVQGEVKVILRGENNGWKAWLIQDFPKNEWFTLTLPLTKPTLESNPPLDLSDVSQIQIGFQQLKPNETYSFLKIDDLHGIISLPYLPYETVNCLVENSSTIVLTHDPDYDATSLLQLVKTGSKIVVFDTNRTNTGFFFNHLQLAEKGYVESNEITLPPKIEFANIQVPFISTNSSDVNFISYYGLDGTSVTPFIMIEKVGLGEIIYVLIPSNIISSLQRPVISLTTIFNEIMQKQEFQVEKSQFNSTDLGSYDTLEGAINLTGTIEVDTKHISSVSPMQSSSLAIVTRNVSTILENITINSLSVYGSAQLILNGQSIKAQVNSASSYLSIIGTDLNQNSLLELSDNTVAYLSLANSNGTFNLQVRGGSLLFDTSKISALIRDPSIKVKGETFFESARIEYTNPYVPIAGAVRENLKINGHTNFNILYSTKDVMLLTNFSYDGVATSSQTSTIARFNIPWQNLLLSPISFMLYLISIAIVMFLVIRKRVLVQNE